MFYQDNNDYMRDSYFYGNNYGNGSCMMYGAGNCQGMQAPYMQNNYQNQIPMQVNQMNSATNLNNMYPQIYKIINPVANRVISNSNYQYITEDSLNNLVDTVFNIVEGDISTLTSNSHDSTASDDNVVNSSSNTRSQNSSSNSSNDRRGNNIMDNGTNNNTLLKDIIKIIIIKELLSRRNMGNNNNNNPYMQNQNGYFNPNFYGMNF